MAKRKSKAVPSESRLFVLALGLLVGFVIAFVLVLSRLPVDNVISQYNQDVVSGAEVEKMNFDYYAVLQAQKAARKPEPQLAAIAPPVVFMEPPAKPLPNVEPPAAPAIAPRPAPQPRVEQVVPRQPIQQARPRVEQPVPPPRIQQIQPPREQLAQQPRIHRPQPPAVLSAPQAPRPAMPVQRDARVREMLANDAGQDTYYVEAGSYQNNADAVNVQSALRRLGLDAFIVVRQDNSGNFGHRVRIGPFLEQSRLDDTRTRLRASGIVPKMIRVKG